MRVAIAGLFEEVNTFAVETMGLATIAGKSATGFQKFEGRQILDEYKGTSTQIGGYIDRSTRARPRSCPRLLMRFILNL